jgi:hypothetical protein
MTRSEGSTTLSRPTFIDARYSTVTDFARLRG